MKIAVLDSGCDFTNPELQAYRSLADVYIISSDGWIRTEEDNTDNAYLHGSSVCRILFENTKKESLHLSMFRVFDSSLTCNVGQLLSALTFICDHVPCDVINMSLGVRAYSRELEDVCRRLYEKGVIIVSAFDNAGAVSYPAAFDFVLGVAGSQRCRKASDFVLLYHSIIDFKAKSGRQRLLTDKAGRHVVNEGNSLAAPYITALVNNLNPVSNDSTSLKKILEPQARHVYSYPEEVRDRDVSWIGRASAFPLNKEMRSLLNFADELVFPLVDFYDIKYSGHVNQTFQGLFSDASFTVKDYEKMEWESFDTLIVGHLEELSLLCKRDLKGELLEACLKYQKNVYSFDSRNLDEYRARFASANLILACPEDLPVPNPKLGMLYQIKTPILAVFGTSKKQGKFTLQLEMRRLLRSRGVRLGQIGTEPNAMLFGMDSVIPFGYSGIQKSEPELIELINDQAARTDRKDYDLLIIGSQSGFLPERFYNLGQISLAQFSLLFAAPPDGVILAVNIQDSPQHIRNIIRSIESVGKTHVFLLALYAFDTTYDYIIDSEKTLLDDQKIAAFRESIRESLHLDVVVTGEPRDADRLFHAIVHYYCEGEINK